MKKILLAFVILLIVVVGATMAQSYLKTNSLFQIGKNPKVTVSNNTFRVTVAKNPADMEIGLSQTSSLPKDKGMLFLFKAPGFYPFWMRSMKISIDIIYINKDKIVTIFSRVKPPVNSNENLTIYRPDEPSDKVLEILAGLSEEYGFKKGDKVIFENI